MIDPTTRQSLSTLLSTATHYSRRSANFLGNAAWILTTSALLVGLPLMLSIEGEAGIVQQEKEFNLAQSQQPVSTALFQLLICSRLTRTLRRQNAFAAQAGQTTTGATVPVGF